MDDLRVALAELKEDSSSAALAPVSAPRRWRRRLWWCVPVAVLAIATVAFYALFRPQPRAAELKVTPLTTYPGMEYSPSFSPDASQFAFVWDGDRNNNLDIYVRLTSGGPALRLTSDPAADTMPAWSRTAVGSPSYGAALFT